MRSKLPILAVLFAAFFIGFFGRLTEANAQAYDMIYRDTSAVNSPQLRNHKFAFDLFQNCAANMVTSTNLPVQYTFNAGAPITEVVSGSSLISTGNPTCYVQTPACSATGTLTFQTSSLVYTCITKINFFSPGIYNVRTRLMGPMGGFQAANISGNFGIEPQTSNTLTTGMVNLPPSFINPPVIFANVNQPVSFSSAALDADGDSLVYRLRPVSLNATYATGFTFLNPITANPALVLNSRTGAITFTPTAYDMVAGPGATANKYVIGLEVDEYRVANGGSTKIGTIQRNILVNVVNNGPQTPVLTASYNNKNLPADTIIDATVGTTVQMDFVASDPNPLNSVYPVSNVYAVLPNAVYTQSLGQNPNWGRLGWTPTAADVRPEPYFFNVAAVNEVCPYPVSVSKTFGIRVKQVTGHLPEDLTRAIFSVFPNPASREVNFKVETRNLPQEILICNLLGQQIDRIALTKTSRQGEAIRWLNAGKYPAGTYIAKLVSADKTVLTRKFTKL